MSICRDQPRASGTTGATKAASPWSRSGTTSTRRTSRSSSARLSATNDGAPVLAQVGQRRLHLPQHEHRGDRHDDAPVLGRRWRRRGARRAAARAAARCCRTGRRRARAAPRRRRTAGRRAAAPASGSGRPAPDRPGRRTARRPPRTAARRRRGTAGRARATGRLAASPVVQPPGRRRRTSTAAASPRKAAATGLSSPDRTAATAAGTRRGSRASAASAATAPSANVVRPETTSATAKSAPSAAPAYGWALSRSRRASSTGDGDRGEQPGQRRCRRRRGRAVRAGCSRRGARRRTRTGRPATNGCASAKDARAICAAMSVPVRGRSQQVQAAEHDRHARRPAPRGLRVHGGRPEGGAAVRGPDRGGGRGHTVPGAVPSAGTASGGGSSTCPCLAGTCGRCGGDRRRRRRRVGQEVEQHLRDDLRRLLHDEVAGARDGHHDAVGAEVA